MTSLLALITAVLLLIASRFLFSTVVSEHAVLLRNKRGRTSRAAVPVITCTLHQSWTRAVEHAFDDQEQAWRQRLPPLRRRQDARFDRCSVSSVEIGSISCLFMGLGFEWVFGSTLSAVSTP